MLLNLAVLVLLGPHIQDYIREPILEALFDELARFRSIVGDTHVERVHFLCHVLSCQPLLIRIFLLDFFLLSSPRPLLPTTFDGVSVIIGH